MGLWKSSNSQHSRNRSRRLLRHLPVEFPSSWRFSPMARFGPWPPSPNCMSLVALWGQDFGSEVVGRPLVVSEFPPSSFRWITEVGLVNGWFEVEIFPFFGGVGGEDGRTRFFNGLSWVKNPFFCWCFFCGEKMCCFVVGVGGWFFWWVLGGFSLSVFLVVIFLCWILFFEIVSKGSLLKGGLDISKLWWD